MPLRVPEHSRRFCGREIPLPLEESAGRRARLWTVKCRDAVRRWSGADLQLDPSRGGIACALPCLRDRKGTCRPRSRFGGFRLRERLKDEKILSWAIPLQ